MNTIRVAMLFAMGALLSPAFAGVNDRVPVSVSRVEANATTLKQLPLQINGRVAAGRQPGSYLRQWPGTVFETAVQGRNILFRLGEGDVKLHVLLDGDLIRTLVKPAPGYYRIGGLSSGAHTVRLEVASESQSGPTSFGGFFGEGRAQPLPMKQRQRQIEFIGDSHTVGYANTRIATECTETEVWSATDTSQGIGPLVAKAYGADYRINAISGRGVVRNYNGFAAAPLPVAYRDTLFGQQTPAVAASWRPDVIVISLGTNDFTTPLNDGEKWKTRAALHADFEDSYVAFVRDLRKTNPEALVVLWATDMAGGEIKAEVAKVATRLQAEGEKRVTFVPIDGLKLNACHGHPSVADDRTIALRLQAAIDQQPAPRSR